MTVTRLPRSSAIPPMDVRASPEPSLAEAVTKAALEMRTETVRKGNAALAHRLTEPSLFIELDASSQRFVQTLVDPATGAVLRSYPNEIQLTFSRGIAAYLKAGRTAA